MPRKPKPKQFENEEAELEDMIRRFDAGESSWDDDDEEVEVEFKQPLDKVIPVRLTADKWSALRREATELGVGPTTLARMWILEKLRSITAEKAAPKAAAKPAPRKRKSA